MCFTKVKCIYDKQIRYPLLRLELVYDFMFSNQRIHQINIPSSHWLFCPYHLSYNMGMKKENESERKSYLSYLRSLMKG